jgi:hypothetical protein
MFACPIKYDKEREILLMMTTTSSSRAKKNKNFSIDEEREVCLSMLHISQDPCIGNGQRKDAFWQRIEAHYNSHKPVGGGHRYFRSLETKWGSMKYNVSKFCGVFNYYYTNKQSGDEQDEIV